MSVRIELALYVEGDGETETSLRESCEWLEGLGKYTPEYQEVIAHLALVHARNCWREADWLREAQRQREQRRRARQPR